ncbi:MAG: 4-(cytidine 5'-diphospho)-2-C-methyl-D-erythritol kinase [Chthoniobacterales bacterium]|nr:MAG: 4-(cytidine 5'-diphospho)-2-C-methyl-D-erythritol kinase [Chthoniobacterales bacterium]
MQLLAPAKINLFFEIKGRRSDGFHEIETLMAPTSLSDRLTIEKEPDGKKALHFSCDDPSLPAGDDNLVVRAVKIFREKTGIDGGVRIALEKIIPHGAGLGGGSSDAAATLMGLNDLFGSNLNQEDLIELAAQLGSDVPFFLLRSAAICTGRGEIVSATRLPKNFFLLLAKPDFGVPTPWAYGCWKDSRPLPGMDYGAQEFSGARFVNDLERPVFEKFVLLAHLKAWLRQQEEVGAALLSGSGSTVFAVLHENADPRALSEKICAEVDPRMWTLPCETLG